MIDDDTLLRMGILEDTYEFLKDELSDVRALLEARSEPYSPAVDLLRRDIVEIRRELAGRKNREIRYMEVFLEEHMVEPSRVMLVKNIKGEVVDKREYGASGIVLYRVMAVNDDGVKMEIASARPYGAAVAALIRYEDFETDPEAVEKAEHPTMVSDNEAKPNPMIDPDAIPPGQP